MLRKEGRLEDDELAQIQEHPKVGARLIRRIGTLRDAIPYVLYHHERWDGTGYPSGKAGKEIPIEARVLAVADAFDAMTSDRPYRRALTHDEALAEVERCSGTQFDPEIARIFLELSAQPRSSAWPRRTRALPRPRASSASGGSPRR